MSYKATNAIVEVRMEDGKLRVFPEGCISSGHVRFPKHLRKLGKKFIIEELEWNDKRGYWIAKGTISEIVKVKK